ncbi:asparagine synthase (glutamine-hydrolyzing) [Novosphingobium tardum]|uniref:asparagine synthase (glutamine-hydrolyzing) n=1 Tax=Novosphingobium tardum TaxID=1538021 RepID=A0ABV8RP00_9SPHN
MCGIAGTLGLTKATTGASAEEMAALLAHRGPDDQGVVTDGPVTLIHRRLAIVDLSRAGHQPMNDASGRFIMVYNGEIYNHRELRAAYLPGHDFRGSSDSETLLELFACQGPAAFGRLNGIFAAAIWDRRDRQLMLARDGAGVKPLYIWAAPGGGIAFASEIKALCAAPEFASALDPVAAAAYATYLWSPGERTMFAAVRKFEAGRWQRFDAAGRLLGGESFYNLPPYRPIAMTPEEAARETADELARAVERQMLADVEVGAFLSGGLDSSAIVHFARKHSARPLQCFTLAYPDGHDAEMVTDLPYARQAAAHLGVSLHEAEITPRMADDLPRLVEMLDEPQADPAAMGNFYIAAAARERGIKVLLGGSGGDDVFTGYRRHSQFAHDGALGAVPGAVRAMLLRVAGSLGRGERARRIQKALRAMQGDADARLCRAFEWLPVETAAGLLARSPSPAEVTRPFTNAVASSGSAPQVERMLRLEQQFFLRDHNLNYVDKTGMAAGVEIRVPFLDPELMAFAATMPLDCKMRAGQTKWALRKAMEPHLPREIIYRPKTGFGVPLRAWMRGPLRDIVGDLTSRQTVARRGLFEPGAVAALRDAHFAGRIDAAYPLLAIVMMELWCRRFADPAPAQLGWLASA